MTDVQMLQAYLLMYRQQYGGSSVEKELQRRQRMVLRQVENWVAC